MTSLRGLLLLVCGLVLSASGGAHAVPALARQTGFPCSQCHTAFPELTAFGRQFKAGAYTLSMVKQITAGGGEQRVSMELPVPIPLGAMAIVGATHTAKNQQVDPAPGAPAALNNDIAMPQQFSVFFAGKVAPKVGLFLQLTFDGLTNHFGFDNTDIRFAHNTELAGKPLIIGGTVNNNPSVSDLWNSTPAWGVPFNSSPSAPSPAASTLIEGKLAQQVAGAGVYGYFDGLIYAEVDLYRSALQGVSLPLDVSTGATNVIADVMPYWRLAVEKSFDKHTLMVGTFGLAGSLRPGGSYTDASGATRFHPLSGLTDSYVDIAFDSQYQYISGEHIVTAQLAYIHESQTLDASQSFGSAEKVQNDLHSFKLSASYLFDRLVNVRATLATTRGSADAKLYGGQGPRATSLRPEVSFAPWQNTRFGLQYVAYFDFNGTTSAASSNDGGAGRSAADNNTVYAYVWTAF